MEKNNVRSERTKAVAKELERWFDSECKVEMEWDTGSFQEKIKYLLDTGSDVSFRRFMVRYLILIYGEELCPSLFPSMNKKDWSTEGVACILQEMEENKEKNYEDSSEILQRLTDKVFDAFVENGVYSLKSAGKDGPKKVMGYINGQGLQWTKDLLLKKLEAVKCGADILDMDADITEDEFRAFAFGLNMSYVDVEFFIRKVFRRAFPNFWDWKDFLLYVTFRYAKGNIYQFYQKLKKYYAEEAEPLEFSLKLEEASAETRTIKNKMDKMLQDIEESNGAIFLDEEGNLPGELKVQICRYKYRIQSAGDRKHTAARISSELLNKFNQDISREFPNKSDPDIKDFLRSIYGEIEDTDSLKAQGRVIVYYELNMGLDIPKGTIFRKPGSKGEKPVEFVATEAVKISPVNSRKEDIVIEVECTETEKKVSRAEDYRAYIPGKTRFTTEDPNLSDITNKSCFKPAVKKAEIGDEIRISGKISAKCEAGKEIPEGTVFYARNSRGEKIGFKSKKTVGAPVCAEIWVEAVKPGEENEASKNEIKECSAKGILRIENKKIGFKQKKQEEYSKGNRLFQILYGSEEDTLDKTLKDTYVKKLGDVFKGAMLSSTKLYNIQRGTEKNITRKDIVTLSFLTYVNESENPDYDSMEYKEEDLAEDVWEARPGYLNFVRKTNQNLEACGFYGLYEMNPYDLLLEYLAGSSEAISSYRNLWGWYLRKVKEASEKTA